MTVASGFALYLRRIVFQQPNNRFSGRRASAETGAFAWWSSPIDTRDHKLMPLGGSVCFHRQQRQLSGNYPVRRIKRAFFGAKYGGGADKGSRRKAASSWARGTKPIVVSFV
jgi:hypothetical protein